MDRAATNDTAPHHDRDWSALQRAGFAVVLLAAVATLGFAALTAPQDAAKASGPAAAEQQTETATRGGGQVINGCTIAPRTRCAAADLREADLRNAELWDAYLWDANLHGANLTGANLWDANLRSADLTGANLSGTTLKFTSLVGADLREADLRGADLSSADLTRADLTGADLTGAVFWLTVMPDGSYCADPDPGGLERCSWQP